MSKPYAWTRYWSDRDASLAPAEGYFPDPVDTPFFTPVEDAYQLLHLVEDPCLALLGEPGLGKTHTLRQAVADLKAEIDDGRGVVDLIDLGAYESASMLSARLVEGGAWNAWTEEGKTFHLFLDSLDEALLHQRSVHKLLISELEKAVDAIPRLRLRIACRSAEWIKELSEDLSRLFVDAHPTWIGPLPRELLLTRLRAADVELAADDEGLDPKEFLRDIADRGLETLAALPLTLSMLLESAKEPEGIPDSRTELFRRASIRLAGEHKTSRRRDPEAGRLHPGQRVALAQRIAAATLFSGHSTIGTEPSNADAGTLDIAEISGYSEEDPDAAGGAGFTVEGDDLIEVLRTALFIDAGPETVQFRHRSLAEFLAASYLARHQLDRDQLVSLFVSPDDDEGRLIPQLREIAAWTAAVYPDAFSEILKREPEVLFRVDQLHLSPEQAAQVVAALLTSDAAEAMGRWDRRLWHNLRGIDHPGLANTLRGPLQGSETPIQVRQLAVTIARACQKQDSEADLLALALDPTEPPHLRSHAIWALEEFGSPETCRSLIPLALQQIPDDEDDEIKGAALQAIYPQHIDAKTVLPILTAPRNDSLLGGYAMFLRRNFPDALEAADLPAALRWAADVRPEHSATDDLNQLVDAILSKAWPHLRNEEIAELVAVVVKRRLLTYAEPLGSLHDESDKATFQETQGRQILLENLLSDTTDDPAVDDKIHPTQLQSSRPSLLRDEDLGWLLDRLEAAIGTDLETPWAALVAHLYVFVEPELDRIFTLLEQSEALRSRIGYRLDPIELSSELAQRLRDAFSRPRDPIPDDAPFMDEEIIKALDNVEGDVGHWAQVNFMLFFGPRGEPTGSSGLQADLTQLPGWKRADEGTRASILATATPYLAEIDPHPDEWLGRNVLDQRAAAGYRALYLLAKCDPGEFNALPDDVWARWAPMILDYPRDSAGDEGALIHDEILREAVARAPSEIAAAAGVLIDRQAEKEKGHLFLLWRLREVQEPALTEELLPKLAEKSMKPQSVADLLEWTIERNPRRSVELVESRLTPEAIEKQPDGRDMAQSVGAVLLKSLPATGWPIVKSISKFDKPLSSSILLDVASGESIDLEALSDEDLAELLATMFEMFNPEEDPDVGGGAHFVSPREQAGRMRGRLLSVLAERGTDKAIEALEALGEQFPDPVFRHAVRAAKDARRAKWRAPEPSHIVQLCVASDARLVFGNGDLQRAVLASLRRIQETLGHGQPPASPELWEGDPPKPKSEERISDWLALRLRNDLQTGARVINREVLIEPSASGKGRGKSTDIQITAPTGKFVEEAEVAMVLVEVKGCWNQKVKSDMEEQLAKRYLAKSSTDHGIYVVLWFAKDGWASDEYRRARCSGDLETSRSLFEDQARTLTDQGLGEIASVVIDGSLTS